MSYTGKIYFSLVGICNIVLVNGLDLLVVHLMTFVILTGSDELVVLSKVFYSV